MIHIYATLGKIIYIIVIKKISLDKNSLSQNDGFVNKFSQKLYVFFQRVLLDSQKTMAPILRLKKGQLTMTFDCPDSPPARFWHQTLKSLSD